MRSGPVWPPLTDRPAEREDGGGPPAGYFVPEDMREDESEDELIEDERDEDEDEEIHVT
jgi:hypothetical protein